MLAAACTHPYGTPPPAPTVLSQKWLIGVDRMRNDPREQLPFTNRLIADLAAMPLTQVVATDTERNAFLFEASPGDKLRVAPWLRADGTCMTAIYTIFRDGKRQDTYGLTIPALPAGFEPDPACVDRFATDFYAALAVQGL